MGSTTKYFVDATPSYPSVKRTYTKPDAIREANIRARAEKYAVAVKVTTTNGKLVHETKVQQIPVNNPEPVPAAKKNTPRKAAARGGRRAGLGGADVAGWEVLYDKPRQNAQVLRRIEKSPNEANYMLYCTAHGTQHHLERMSDEGAVRRAGGWCGGCAA